MIRASAEAVLDPWARKAAPSSTIVPISRFLDPHVFALKTGGYGCLFSLTGIDEEAYTDQELEAHLRTLEGTLRGMPERATLYQYTRIRNGYRLFHQEHYAHPATRRFVADRLAHLNKTADFRRIDLHWCLIVEPAKRQPECLETHLQRLAGPGRGQAAGAREGKEAAGCIELRYRGHRLFGLRFRFRKVGERDGTDADR